MEFLTMVDKFSIFFLELGIYYQDSFQKTKFINQLDFLLFKIKLDDFGKMVRKRIKEKIWGN